MLSNGELVISFKIYLNWDLYSNIHYTDKIHQTLSADMLVSDNELTVLIDGSGNCIEIEDGVVAIGSGGLYA